MTVAVFAAPFDPIHNGHLDVIARSAKVFDKLYIGIYDRPTQKRFLFTTEERLEMVKEATQNIPDIEVQTFTGMVADYAYKVGAKTLIRTLRMTSDFELELEKDFMSKKLHPELELVCFMVSLEYQFLSSRMLKEVARMDGNVYSMVPENVAGALKQKVLENKITL